MPELYDDIYEYLGSQDNIRSVTAKGLEEYIHKVCAHTKLDLKEATLITRLFFQEIRNSMLRGDFVLLGSLGKFYISSPRTTGNKKDIRPRFKQPYKSK